MQEALAQALGTTEKDPEEEKETPTEDTPTRTRGRNLRHRKK
jgi:hypothetical protein